MTSITVSGNIGRAELRFIPSGKAVLNGTVADNVRRFDKDRNEWVNVRTDWHSFAVWGDKAEALAEHLKPGVRVIVTGRLGSREFEKDGAKRIAWEIEADEVGIVPRAGAPRQSQGAQGDDPWATR